MRLSIILLFFTVSSFFAFSQSYYSVSGSVKDAETQASLPSATVSLSPLNKHVQTDADGNFRFSGVLSGEYIINIQFIGYDSFLQAIHVKSDTVIHSVLQPVRYALSEVVVKAYGNMPEKQVALPVRQISRNYLLQNNATNFAKTLASLPGISSMDIGSGFSKPVIRGMGFNRVAVVDKGIVQQNQQWGADHGLEIDQYDVDNVLIHKGPLSLLYGSDAIGGVIEILPVELPQENRTWGDATLITKSNNNLLGASVMGSWKHDKWFVRARFTGQHFGDYRIPADTITYLTWKMPVYNNRMKNTAGSEYTAALSANYTNRAVNSWLHISNIYGKTGFFPGSHGIPDIKRLQHDGSYRNIDMPYAFSNHFKIINNTRFQLPWAAFCLDLGFQQNHREEISRFHTHYSNQKPPEKNPNLELQFLLNTYSINARMVFHENSMWSKTIGFSSEFQHNRVGGYSFLLPDFERFATGAYWLNTVKLSDRFSLLGGIRYDVGRLNVHASFDPTLEEYLRLQGYMPGEVQSYAQRAEGMRKTFNDFSGSLGFVYTLSRFETLKMNVGKSFRYPSANELASNGVHHGAFRHEKGADNLRSEEGYQFDLEYTLSHRKISISLQPFITYFSNYIYLEPSGEWSLLPHSGQIYQYKQTKAWVGGGEFAAEYALNAHWKTAINAEYIYNLNSTDGYPLPFSPPTVFTGNVSYSGNRRGILNQYTFRLENQWTLAQNRIARNEEKTPATNLWHASANLHWKVGNIRFITDFQVQNIFDTAFLNHLSFYRKLNAPEAGRNVQLIWKIPF